MAYWGKRVLVCWGCRANSMPSSWLVGVQGGGADSHRLSLDADGLSICWIIGGLGHSRPDYSLVYSFEEGDRGRRLRRMGDDRLTSVVGWHPVA